TRADYWHILGTAYIQLGCFTEAAAALEQALLLRPDYALAANDLGLVRMLRREIEQAVRDFQRALRVQPNYADAHVNLASAFRELGRIKEAVHHYRKALRIQPDQVTAFFHLSQFVAVREHTFSATDLEQIKSLVKSERQPARNRSIA